MNKEHPTPRLFRLPFRQFHSEHGHSEPADWRALVHRAILLRCPPPKARSPCKVR